MNQKKVAAFFFLFLPFLLLEPSVSNAYWVWSPESGKFVNPETAVQDTADEQYDYAMKFYKERNLDEASNQLKGLLKKFPGSRIAPEAQYRLATIYEERGDYMKAFNAYKVLVESYPQSERLNEVIERKFRIGNLFLSGKKGKLLGLEILPSLPRAVEVFDSIVKQAPYSDFGDDAQFHLGLAYKKWGRFEESVKAFQGLIDRYPQSTWVPQARYQLAETAYAHSSAQYRDQRVLDDASKQVDRFLSHHPDTHASEKASKLRQAIDEKNAEKNFRIGSYYEKENYLESALIYYEDVADRYPHTKWGQKVAVKLKALKQPAGFHEDQKKILEQKRTKLEAELKSLAEKSDERRDAERELEKVSKAGRQIDKNMKDSLKSRKKDLERRSRELKEKFKNLERKKKLGKRNPSEDFKRALERWLASLEKERQGLEKEKAQLREWRKESGISEKKWQPELPFVGGQERSPVEKIQQIGAKKLFKISQEKRELFEKKETLYEERAELAAGLRLLRSRSAAKPGAGISRSINVEEIQNLENELRKKRESYEREFGESNLPGWVWAPTKMVTRSADVLTKSIDRSIDFLNPFSPSSEKADIQQFLEKRMHLKEKIATQQNLIQTLHQAFDAQLALDERKRLLAQLKDAEKADPRRLRQSIKRTEKQIRQSYQEIQDRHERKKKLLADLDRVLKQERSQGGLLQKTGHAVSFPAVAAYKSTKAFFFGLPSEEVELTKTAGELKSDSAQAEQAKSLKEQIELESLMIEARHREIQNLQKQLEILKAKASLAGGYRFRSPLVRVPYEFLGEAIESARSVVPKRERQVILADRMNEETSKLEEMKAELRDLEKEIAALSEKTPEKARTKSPAVEKGVAGPREKAAAAGSEKALSALRSNRREAEEIVMQEEIARLARELEAKRNAYEAAVGRTKTKPAAKADAEKDLEDLRETEAAIVRLIQRETELEQAESEIFEQRIRAIDPVVKKVTSKATSQDLLTERERIESRLSEIDLRRDFLSKELKRFESRQTPKVPA